MVLSDGCFWWEFAVHLNIEVEIIIRVFEINLFNNNILWEFSVFLAIVWDWVFITGTVAILIRVKRPVEFLKIVIEGIGWRGFLLIEIFHAFLPKMVISVLSLPINHNLIRNSTFLIPHMLKLLSETQCHPILKGRIVEFVNIHTNWSQKHNLRVRIGYC